MGALEADERTIVAVTRSRLVFKRPMRGASFVDGQKRPEQLSEFGISGVLRAERRPDQPTKYTAWRFASGVTFIYF